MATSTVLRNATSNQATFDYTTVQLFLGPYETVDKEYENVSGALEDVAFGQLVGVIASPGASSGRWTKCKSAALDGSAVPRGVIVDELSQVAIGGTVPSVTIVDLGFLNKDQIVLDGTDTLDTPVDGVRMEDLLREASRGIKLGNAPVDPSKHDN